jgi:hypothetical protein
MLPHKVFNVLNTVWLTAIGVVAKEPRQRVVYGRRTGSHASTDSPKELTATPLLRTSLFGVTLVAFRNEAIPHDLLLSKWQSGKPLVPIAGRTATTCLFVKVTDEGEIVLCHNVTPFEKCPRLDGLSLSK